MLQFIKGWRTVIYSGLLGTASTVLACYDQLPAMGVDIRQVIAENVPTTKVGTIGCVISVGVLWLRLVTTTAVGNKD